MHYRTLPYKVPAPPGAHLGLMVTGCSLAPGVMVKRRPGGCGPVVVTIKDTLKAGPSPRGGWGGNHSPPPINYGTPSPIPRPFSEPT